jgi:hypothetical protein
MIRGLGVEEGDGLPGFAGFWSAAVGGLAWFLWPLFARIKLRAVYHVRAGYRSLPRLHAIKLPDACTVLYCIMCSIVCTRVYTFLNKDIVALHTRYQRVVKDL